ncbi:MAG: outer membrane beta-barrel protein [Holosporaceae bacterium]|jgi:hypothetical protein|nr:outer membrane beta-barrel protein [Holosporaceae bacterium]
MKKLAFAVLILSIPQAIASADCFDGIYFGGGFGYYSADDIAQNISYNEEVSINASRVIGTVLFGSGKTANARPLYLGGEILLDFAKTHRSNVVLRGQNVRIRDNGLAPSFGIRFGYAAREVGTLFFGRVGFAHRKITLDSGVDSLLKTSKLIPTLGIGIEKALYDKCTFRFDLEYATQRNKNNGIYKLECGHSVSTRLMIIYNTKF